MKLSIVLLFLLLLLSLVIDVYISFASLYLPPPLSLSRPFPFLHTRCMRGFARSSASIFPAQITRIFIIISRPFRPFVNPGATRRDETQRDY